VGAAFITLFIVCLLYVLVVVVPVNPGPIIILMIACVILTFVAYFVLMRLALRREAAQAELALQEGELPLDEVFEMPLEYLEASQSMRDVQPQKKFSFRDTASATPSPFSETPEQDDFELDLDDELSIDEPFVGDIDIFAVPGKPDYSDDLEKMDLEAMRKQPPSEQIPYDLDFLFGEGADAPAPEPEESKPTIYEQLAASIPYKEKDITAPIKKVVVPIEQAGDERGQDVLFDTSRGAIPEPALPVITPPPAFEVTPPPAVEVMPPPPMRPVMPPPPIKPVMPPPPIKPAMPAPPRPVIPAPPRPLVPLVARDTAIPPQRHAIEPSQPLVPKQPIRVEPTFTPTVSAEPVAPVAPVVPVVPVVVSAPAVDDKPTAAAISYDNCVKKAESMANRGMWPMSAVLYEESSLLAGSSEERLRSIFAAMTSYTKANKLGDVRRLVELVSQETNLSPTYKIKLQAISKMLK